MLRFKCPGCGKAVEIERKLGVAARFLPHHLTKALCTRLIVAQGYLHSHLSSKLKLSLSGAAEPRLSVMQALNPSVPATVSNDGRLPVLVPKAVISAT